MSSEALTKTFSDEQRLQLALAIAVPGGTDLAPRLEDAARQLAISTGDLALLLNDPAFLKLVRGLTKAQALLTLHGQGIGRLVEIARKGKDGEAISALKIIGQISGDLRAGNSLDVKISFDDLRKRSADDDPLRGICDIKTVIDAEEEDE